MRGRCLVSSVPLWRSHGQLRSANAFANPTANRLAHSGGPQPSGVGAARSLPPQHAQLAAPAPTVPTAGAQTGPTARGMRGPPDMPGLLACRFSVRGVLWAWGSGAPFSHQCHRDLSHICVPFLSKVPPDQGRLSRGSCPARGQFPERGGQPLCVRVTGGGRPHPIEAGGLAWSAGIPTTARANPPRPTGVYGHCLSAPHTPRWMRGPAATPGGGASRDTSRSPSARPGSRSERAPASRRGA